MRVAIVGAGKVGTALAYAIRTAGFSVAAVASRTAESLRRAETYIGKNCLYTSDVIRAVDAADVIAITTQDRQIRPVAQKIFDGSERLDEKIFFHTSGAQNRDELKPLDEKGALLGSLHPLQTFPDIDAGISALPQTPVFIEGDEKALPVLEEIGSAVGDKVYRINSDDKLLYHLSAVFVCNLFTALLYSGEEIMNRIGVTLEAFSPIIHTTLKNIETRGTIDSLTGPVVRGDARTISAHLSAMKDMPSQARVYKALSSMALEIARKRNELSPEQLQSLKELLE